MSKTHKEESSFRHPPLWIHVSEAGKWLFYPREAKKRAVLRLIDRIAVRAQPRRPGSDPKLKI